MAARLNWKKSEAFALVNGVIISPGPGLEKDGLKYLGLFLTNEIIVEKNWENFTDKTERKLAKWKWLLPQMSYRGRVLVLNSLEVSLLWHRLACVNPPSG